MTDATSTTDDARPTIGLIRSSLLRADATVLLRSGRTLLVNIAVPILYLVITNLHLGHKGRGFTYGSTGFTIGLALTVGLMSSSLMGYATTIAHDRDAGRRGLPGPGRLRPGAHLGLIRPLPGGPAFP